MNAIVSCVATSLAQAEEILAGFELLAIDSQVISCLIPEQELEEDVILGRLQFEYVLAPNLGHFFASGPIGRALQTWSHPSLAELLSEFGQSPEVARLYEDILADHHIFIAVACDDVRTTHRVSSFLQSAKAGELVVSNLSAKEWDEPVSAEI